MSGNKMWKSIKRRYRMFRHSKLVFARLIAMTGDAEKVENKSIEAKNRLKRTNAIIKAIITGEVN